MLTTLKPCGVLTLIYNLRQIFMNNKSFTLKQLAELTESTLFGDPEYCITNVESLELASPSDASFLSNSRYEKAMLKSQAGVIFVTELPKDVKDRKF